MKLQTTNSTRNVFSSLQVTRSNLKIAFFLMVAIGLVFPFMSQEPGLVFFFAVILIGLGTISLNYFYSKEYRNKMVPLMMTEIFPDAKYDANRKIDKRILNQSKILPYHDRMYGADYIQTNWFGMDAQLCNLILSKKNGKSRITTFNGTFIHCDSQTKSRVALLIKNSTFLKFFSSTNKIKDKKLNRLSLVAPQLSREVDIWTDDQIAARVVLQPALLIKLENLFKKNKVFISIVDNEINFAIEGLKIKTSPRFFLLEPYSIETKTQLIKESIESIKTVIETLSFHNKGRVRLEDRPIMVQK